MKRILTAILLLALTLSLASCSLFSRVFGKSNDNDNDNDSNDHDDGSKPGSDFNMTASVTEIGDKIAVEVIESPYGNTGPFWVNTAKATEYFDKDGNAITRSDIHVGDTVEILYSGQVMMSYPPQIVAAKITVK